MIIDCPRPHATRATVLLGHGGGGTLSRELVEGILLPAYGSPELARLADGAVLDVPPGRLALTTDAFVVHPRFFPGGDLGSLAVHGTVNDLAMCGARPLALAVALVLEEGLPLEELRRLAGSMAAAAAAVPVPIVTGDTKVVDRGKGDGVFVTTTGVGVVVPAAELGAERIRPGDAVLVSGSVGTHGVAVLSVREGLAFGTDLLSDSAPLWGLVEGLLNAVGSGVRVLRDPTRGGVASAMNELARSAGVAMLLDEGAAPVEEAVRGACELLGLDPLYVANEGKLVAVVAPDAADAALAALRGHPLGARAARMGTVTAGPPGRVVLRTPLGGERVLEMLSGEQLPRIC